MPLIERKILGTGQAKQEGSVITWDYGEILANANVITYVDVALPESTVINSVQMSTKNIQLPSLPSYSFYSGGPSIPPTAGPPGVLQGLYFIESEPNSYYLSKWYLIGAAEARVRHGDAYVQALLGSIDINATPIKKPRGFGGPTALMQYTDGSYHYLLSIVRPLFTTRVPTFINLTIIWYPFSIDVEVTGYALEGISSTGVPDEQISVRVIDETCQDFYGVRPGKEEQSDFIENQIQAARVGEQLLWQSQMVLDGSLLVPITPAIKRGSTARIYYPNKNLDILGLVKNVTHSFNIDAQGMGSGTATTQCEIKATEFIFRTAGGETQDSEKLDKRQT